MPIYQNATVTTTKLIIGNFKMETSPYASAAGSFTWVNLGAGIVNSGVHNVEKYNVQAGNAPDPMEGISREDVKVEMELIEYDASALTSISCGAMTGASAGTVYTVIAGGNTVLTPRAFRFTNTRIISGATKETILTVFSATVDNGFSFNAKSDNDTDPIMVMPVSITGKPDSTRSAGTQLFTISKTL